MKIFVVRTKTLKKVVGCLVTKDDELIAEAYTLDRLETIDYADDIPLRTLVAKFYLSNLKFT